MFFFSQNPSTMSFALHEEESDDWLDVTTKEELLQRELNGLKTSLEEKSFELTETNITVDVLKGHKLLLENERFALKKELQEKDEILSSLQTDVNSFQENETRLKTEFEKQKETFKRQVEELQQTKEQQSFSLNEANESIAFMTKRIVDLEDLHQKEIEKKMQEFETLKASFAAMKAQAKVDRTELANYKLRLQESNKREAVLNHQLSEESTIANKCKHDLKSLKADTGAIAIVAENLRAEKQSLERALTRINADFKRTQENLYGCQTRENDFREELSKWKFTSESRIAALENELNSSTCDLKDSRSMIASLSESLDDLRKQLKQVQESLSVECAKTQRLQEAQKRIFLDFEEKEKGHLLVEEELREELRHARQATEKRLDELREILGVPCEYSPPQPYWKGYEPPLLSNVMSFV